MSGPLTRRDFMKTTALASAAAGALSAESSVAAAETPAAPLPLGRIGKHSFSRLMLGGNLISGYSHSRDLGYVAALARRYNTEAKIRETIELAESHGINAINLCIGDDISFLQAHWKNGGKMRLIAQAHIGNEGDLANFKQAIDTGASAVHVQGLSAERHIKQGRVDLIASAIAYVKKQGAAAGVAAHALNVIVECENTGLDVDFYQKTLHTRDYFSAGNPEDSEDIGRHDNYWCRNPEEVAAFMAKVKKPWIAFKVLAAGAIQPRAGFAYALKNGADFLLAGMFDWQVADNATLARRMFSNLERPRPLYG